MISSSRRTAEGLLARSNSALLNEDENLVRDLVDGDDVGVAVSIEVVHWSCSFQVHSLPEGVVAEVRIKSKAWAPSEGVQLQVAA